MTQRLLAFVALIAFVCASGAVGASAQTNPAPGAVRTKSAPVQFGVGILGGVPVGDFATNVEDAGGLYMHVGVGVRESPVTIGGEFAYLWYGQESRRVPFSETIPDAMVTVNTDNAMTILHAIVRVQPPHGRWRPYADGMFGFNYIYTQTSIDVGTSFQTAGGGSSSSIAGTTNLDDFAPSYGAGGGVMIRLGSSPRSPRFDVSVRYLAGGEADYLREGAIRRENGQAILDVSRSRTDMVSVYIGVAIGR